MLSSLSGFTDRLLASDPELFLYRIWKIDVPIVSGSKKDRSGFFNFRGAHSVPAKGKSITAQDFAKMKSAFR